MDNNFDDSLFDETPLPTKSVNSSFDDSLFDETPATVTEDTSPGKLESFIKGAEQGATFGFADELGAGIQSGLDKILGGISDTDEMLKSQGFKLDDQSVYDKAVKENREEYKLAEEANPMTSMAGNIAGGLTTSLLPGVAPIMGGSAATTLSTKGLLSTAIPKLAASGAVMGGLDAAGRSEAEDLGGVVSDVTSGAKSGAILGAGIPVAGKAIKGLSGIAKDKIGAGLESLTSIIDPKLTEQVKSSYDIGKRGLDVIGKNAEETLNKDTMILANRIKESVKGKFDTASSRLGEILEEASEGKDFSQFAREIEDELTNNPNLSNDLKSYLSREISKFKNKEVVSTVISGEDLAKNKLMKNMEKFRGRQDALGNEYVQDMLPVSDEGNFLQAMNTRLKQDGSVAGRNVSQEFIPSDKLVKATVEDFREMSLSDLNNLASELNKAAKSNSINPLLQSELKDQAKKVKDYISKNLDETASTEASFLNKEMRDVHRLGDIDKSLSRAQHNNPDVDLDIQKLIKSTEDNTLQRARELGGLGSQIPEDIADIRTRNELLKEGTKGTGLSLESLTRIPKSMLLRSSNKVGNWIGKLNNADSTNLVNLSERLAAKGHYKYADQLMRATNPQARSKVLFILSQQPEFRKLLEQEEE